MPARAYRARAGERQRGKERNREGRAVGRSWDERVTSGSWMIEGNDGTFNAIKKRRMVDQRRPQRRSLVAREIHRSLLLLLAKRRKNDPARTMSLENAGSTFAAYKSAICLIEREDPFSQIFTVNRAPGEVHAYFARQVISFRARALRLR